MFLGVGVGLVFFDGVLPRFLLYGLAVRPRNCLSSFFGGVFVDAVSAFSVFFKRDRSGKNRTPPHALALVFFCFYPTVFGLSPFLAVRRVSWRFLGVPFCAPRVFGILLELAGLKSARPFRSPFLWTRGVKGVSPLLFCGFCFLFGVFVALRRPANQWLDPTAGPGCSTSRPSPASRVGAMDAPFPAFFFPYFVYQRVTGTLGRTASGEELWFVRGGGGLSGVFGVLFRGKCCAFFFAARFSGDCPLSFPKFYPSSKGFRERAGRGMRGRFFALKCHCFCVPEPDGKNSLRLGYGFP